MKLLLLITVFCAITSYSSAQKSETEIKENKIELSVPLPKENMTMPTKKETPSSRTKVSSKKRVFRNKKTKVKK